jgi:hypothetical protein
MPIEANPHRSAQIITIRICIEQLGSTLLYTKHIQCRFIFPIAA